MYIVNIDCKINVLKDERFMTAQEAAAALGVATQTLYAYASRGMLRSESVPGQPRTRRYFREDVDRLVERKEVRRSPEKASPRSLNWGNPVLDSAITLIEAGRLYYRGHDAVELARSATVEEVAALLWTGATDRSAEIFAPSDGAVLAQSARTVERIAGLGAIERCQMVLPLAGLRDQRAYDLRPGPAAFTGARILRLLAVVAGSGVRAADSPIDSILQTAWALHKPAARVSLRAALILCADHELNVSAFTARCAASAGSTPYDVVAAGLAALKGKHHGGHTAQVEALLNEIGKPARARDIVAAKMRQAERLPGFGHRLYPGGDPRAKLLISLATSAARGQAASLVNALTEAGREIMREHPNLDFGLAALAHVLRLPPGSALAIFALGRSIGWIAHAIEQYGSNQLIRPRARYVGPDAID